MGRYLIVLGVLTAAGCQGYTTNYSPFAPYGPTQVPPPPTGSAGRPDPYYRSQSAEDARLSRRWFTSDEQRDSTSTADRRAEPGPLYNDAAELRDSSSDLRWRTTEPGRFQPPAQTDALPRPRFPGPAQAGGPLTDPNVRPAAAGIPRGSIDYSGWTTQ